MDYFKPEIIEEHTHTAYGTLLVTLEKCHVCEKWMIAMYCPPTHFGSSSLFGPIGFDYQIKEAGWVLRSGATRDDYEICKECFNAGQEGFRCALCNQVKPMSKSQESFGYPTEYLCKDCFEIIPAKVWAEKVKELIEKHKYDFNV